MGNNWNMCQNLNTWGVFWMNQVHMRQCRRKVVSAIRSLVIDIGLHEALLMPVLMYVSGTMIWKEKEKSRIRTTSKGFWVLGGWIKS